MKRFRIKEKAFIEDKLVHYLPMVIEINLIAEKLERKVFFEAKLRYVYAEQYKADDLLDLNALKKG